MRQSDWRKVLGNTFIAVGLLLLLGVGGVYGWEQWQGQQLRDELQAEPTVSLAVLTSPTAISATQEPTLAPTEEPTVMPTIAPAEPVAVVQPEVATDAPASPTDEPTVAPTPTQAPTATPVPIPTPIPATKPVRLTIPDLKIDIPVTDMTWKVINSASGPQSEWEIPENSAGFAINSALLGDPGNTVISGHNNIYGRVFMRISQAWPDQGFQKVDAYTDRSTILDGRQVILTGADGRRVTYIITAFYRVKDSSVPLGQRIKNAEWIAQTANTELTLTTCWPPWSNTHRLIVIAQPAS
jgi:sortase (surface protein transpeptidase)